MIQASVIDNTLDIQTSFQKAHPFRHVVVENFFDQDVCESLLRDFPAFDPEKARNEVGEIGGKAVYERLTKISPFYKSFYDYINSKTFLDTVSELTGIPDLIADETLFGGGTHENRDGQYLDVHVDFNIDERRMLHRRLNLLVYLNTEWEEKWGGLIELHSNPRAPDANEVKSFLPLFNRAVIFETNEYSWHGFERINLPADKKHLSRKSVSIYLYTKDRPAEEVVAPHTTFYLARPLSPEISQEGRTLSHDDMQKIRLAIANRDGLLAMYQNLLIEKEQRLRDMLSFRQSGAEADYRVVLSSRSWRFIMFLHRVKAKLRMLFGR
jgi:hypothetical protein